MAFNPQEHMIKLKDKDYLQVKWRLVWFREEHPDWCINTDLIAWDKEKQLAVLKASILEPSGHTVSTGYGSESIKDFGDYLEKAETKAVGRALAMLGFGTQFAPDLDEEERIVDSPVERPKKEIKKVESPVEKQKKSSISANIPQEEKKKDRETVYNLVAQFIDHGIDPVFVCQLYGVKTVDDMSETQRKNAAAHLDDILEKQKKGQKA